jgi:copper chaperone NosL
MKLFTIIFMLALTSSACSVDPEPIQYGVDNCANCRMTIMDKRFGSEIVTAKGKVYKFDSVECLVEFMENNQKDKEKFSMMLFTPFDQPGKLVDARESHVLHSKNLPSPMGLYLTAFDSEATAMDFKDQYGGKVYCWDGLMENFDLLRLKGAGE